MPIKIDGIEYDVNKKHLRVIVDRDGPLAEPCRALLEKDELGGSGAATAVAD